MGIRIILVRTKHSGNVGSVARAMKNFGLSDLVLVAPRCRIDKQAFALASHAGDVLERAKVVETVAESLDGRTFVLGTSARLRASPAFETLPPRQAIARLPSSDGAIVFGPEDTGLSNAELDQCQLAVRIPTAEYASLNLAQAVNVLAYEWFVRFAGEQPANAESQLEQDPSSGSPASCDSVSDGPVSSIPVSSGPVASDVAPRDQVEPMLSQLMETLLHIGYTDESKAASVEHMFRRMLDRAALTSREVAALRGLWSQARWAADQAPDRLPGRRRSR